MAKKKHDPRNKDLNSRILFLVTPETRTQLNGVLQKQNKQLGEYLRVMLSKQLEKDSK
jgi:hypothetical protein